MKNSILVIGYLLINLSLMSSCDNRSIQLSSPDNTVGVLFSLVDGQPRYAITKNGNPVIEPSAMGFDIPGRTDHTTRYRLVSVERSSGDERWEQPWGESRFIEDSL